MHQVMSRMAPLVVQDDEELCINTHCLLANSNTITVPSLHHLSLVLRQVFGADTQEAQDCHLLQFEKQFALTTTVSSEDSQEL